MSQSFPQFALLPLELRRTVWSWAAAGWTQDIHFSISTYKSGWERSPDESRKHIFASELAVPPLLYACHDSRVAAIEHYSLGLEIEISDERGLRQRDCPYDTELKEVAKRTFWEAESDVIVLEHGEEPFSCGSCTKGNLTPFQRQEYKLDKRIKYLAVTMDVWNSGSGTITFDVPALEALYVIVDKKPCFAFPSSGRDVHPDTLESIQKESCRVIEAQMKHAVSCNAALFKLKRNDAFGIRIDLEVVEGLDELVEKVGKRRAASELRKASNTTT